MTIESRRLTVDDERRIAFRNHTVLMTLHRADALIPLPRNGAIHYFAYPAAGDYLPTVARCIANSNDSSHGPRSFLTKTIPAGRIGCRGDGPTMADTRCSLRVLGTSQRSGRLGPAVPEGRSRLQRVDPR